MNLTHSRMQNTLFPPTAVGNTTCISHWLGERNPNCHRRCPHRVSLITRPFRELTKGKGIIAETQQRRGQGHVPNGHKELTGSFSPRCLQRMGWVWSERNSFQGLVSLLLHAIYLLLPDTPHQAFVNVLEKTLALITDDSYPKDTIRSKLAPSLGFPSEYRASQTSAARVSC